MVGAYATFANQGLRMKPFLIDRITDREGNVVEQATPRATDALRADTAFILTSPPARGRRARHGGPGAPASGGPSRARRAPRTTSPTPGSSATSPRSPPGCGSGFDEKKDSLGRGETGADAALPIWMDFWAAATADRPVEEHPIPGNVVFVPVDEMGRPGAPGAAGVRMEAFVAGTEPRATEGAPPAEQ